MTISPLTNSFIPADFLKDTFLFVKLAIATGILQHKHSESATLYRGTDKNEKCVFHQREAPRRCNARQARDCRSGGSIWEDAAVFGGQDAPETAGKMSRETRGAFVRPVRTVTFHSSAARKGGISSGTHLRLTDGYVRAMVRRRRQRHGKGRLQKAWRLLRRRDRTL